MKTNVKTFPYHLVAPSPWPALASFGMLSLTIGFVITFHKYSGGLAVLISGLLTLIFVSSSWWRDIYRESAEGCHTNKVKAGLHLGLLFFIVTELMFFVGLLWASMHAALMPTVQIGQAWPPVGIVPVDWTRRPLLNSVVLATSFFSANAVKHALDTGDNKGARVNLVITILLGLIFVGFQYLEYTDAPFTFSDSAFGSTFFLTTGFHGFHVILGIIYLVVCLFTLNSMGPRNSTAFDLALVYWHMVDVVWIFVFIIVYAWNGTLPSYDIDTASDGALAVYLSLRDTRLDLFLHQNVITNIT